MPSRTPPTSAQTLDDVVQLVGGAIQYEYGAALGRLTWHDWRAWLTERRDAIAWVDAAVALWERTDLDIAEKLAHPTWRECDLWTVTDALIWSADHEHISEDLPLQTLVSLVKLLRTQKVAKVDRSVSDGLRYTADTLDGWGVTTYDRRKR